MNAVPQRPKCFARLQDAHGLKGGLVWHVKRVKRLETELDSSRDAEAEVDSKLQELQAQHEQYVGKTDRKLAKLLAKLVRLQEEAQTCQQAKARAERQALQASTQLACKAREVDQLEEAAAAVDVRIMLAEVAAHARPPCIALHGCRQDCRLMVLTMHVACTCPAEVACTAWAAMLRDSVQCAGSVPRTGG